MVRSMERIKFNDERMRDAYILIEIIQEELEHTGREVQDIREKMRGSIDMRLFTEKWCKWERLYAQILERIRLLSVQMLDIMAAYQETEQKNKILVEQLPLPDGAGYRSRKEGGWMDKLSYEQELSGFSVGSTWFSSRIWHDDWVIQAVESIL